MQDTQKPFCVRTNRVIGYVSATIHNPGKSLSLETYWLGFLAGVVVSLVGECFCCDMRRVASSVLLFRAFLFAITFGDPRKMENGVSLRRTRSSLGTSSRTHALRQGLLTHSVPLKKPPPPPSWLSAETTGLACAAFAKQPPFRAASNAAERRVGRRLQWLLPPCTGVTLSIPPFLHSQTSVHTPAFKKNQ